MIDREIKRGLAREIIILIVLALCGALILLAGVILLMPRKEKPEYPTHTPTVLPTIPAWTPDPGEVGKG